MINHKIYDEIELTSDVMSASNHRLIALLFNKYMQRIHHAELSMNEKHYEKKAREIVGALQILQYLRNCLDYRNDQSKELVVLLDSLYAYAQRNLTEANIHNDLSYLNEAKKVIEEVKAGWDGIAE